MEYPSRCELIREVDLFFPLLFDNLPTSQITECYIKIHESLEEFKYAPLEQRRTLKIIVGKKMNAVAIEPWLRRNERRHLLSAKLLLLVYLFECTYAQGCYPKHMSARRRVLIVSVITGAYRLLCGIFIKWRYGMV